MVVLFIIHQERVIKVAHMAMVMCWWGLVIASIDSILLFEKTKHYNSFNFDEEAPTKEAMTRF